jgi:siroheme synthase (precorrin-2 oxidase/ferrochelatase)
LFAPNLEEMIDPTIAEKRRSGFFDKSHDDTVEKRTMTLEQMMNLPEDREHLPEELDFSDRSAQSTRGNYLK